jgi:hypothetical protein
MDVGGALEVVVLGHINIGTKNNEINIKRAKRPFGLVE